MGSMLLVGSRPRVGPLLRWLLTGLICLEPMAMAYYVGVAEDGSQT